MLVVILIVVFGGCGSAVHPRVRHAYAAVGRGCGRLILTFGQGYAHALGWDAYADGMEADRYQTWLREHAPEAER